MLQLIVVDLTMCTGVADVVSIELLLRSTLKGFSSLVCDGHYSPRDMDGVFESSYHL